MKSDNNKLEKLWDEFSDVPFDEDTEDEMVLADNFHVFEKGIPRYHIWHWFDENHSKGVAYLLNV